MRTRTLVISVFLCSIVILLALYIIYVKYYLSNNDLATSSPSTKPVSTLPRTETIKTRKSKDLDCSNLEETDLVTAETESIPYTVPKKYLEENTRKEYYNILKSTNDILNKNNIPYVLHAGTLLGSYRHLDIIPWDDDADICIKFEDNDKLMNLVEEFKNEGIILHGGCFACWTKYYEDVCKYCNLQHKKGHKDFVNVNMEEPCLSTPYFATLTKGDVHIDIFHVIPIIDKYEKIMYSLDGGNKLLSQSQYDKLFETKDCKFGDLILKCPSNTKEILCQHYGFNIDIPNKKQMENKDNIPGMWSGGKNDVTGYFKLKDGEIIINNFKS
jgi:hypothetical protein